MYIIYYIFGKYISSLILINSIVDKNQIFTLKSIHIMINTTNALL